jgi:hypothetical protein
LLLQAVAMQSLQNNMGPLYQLIGFGVFWLWAADMLF